MLGQQGVKGSTPRADSQGMSEAVAAWRAERARRLAEYDASLLPAPEAPEQRRFREHHEAKRRALDEAEQRRSQERWVAWRAEQDIRDRVAAGEAAARRQEEAVRSQQEAVRAQARAATEVERARLRPPMRFIRNWQDAEKVVAEWMPHLGMGYGAITGGGRDGGVDVESATHVAQVKLEGKPTGRPAVQQLFGAAQCLGKGAAFFAAAGYTNVAVQFAAEARVELYVSDRQGVPERLDPDRDLQEPNLRTG